MPLTNAERQKQFRLNKKTKKLITDIRRADALRELLPDQHLQRLLLINYAFTLDLFTIQKINEQLSSIKQGE